MGVLPSALGPLLLVTGLAAAPSATAVDEGPLRNSTPLPDQQVAAAALRAGDDAWDEAAGASAAEQRSARAQAFDRWRNALLLSSAGDGVRLLADPEAQRSWLADPFDTHARRSEDAAVAVQRRLLAVGEEHRRTWIERFSPQADAALARGLAGDAPSGQGLGEVERTFPATVAASRAALALADLELERGRPGAATVWLGRAARHAGLGASIWPGSVSAAVERALELRRAGVAEQLSTTFVGDHTAPQEAFPSAPPGRAGAPLSLRLVGAYRVSGIARTPDEPFGRGLGSGAALLRDGSLVVQGAYGLLVLDEGEEVGWREETRTPLDVLFGTNRPLIRASASAGGWKSYPVTDGARVALVFGRGDRRRPFMDIEVPPSGNMLGLLERASSDQALDPAWVLRDGFLVSRPSPKRRSGDLPTAPTGGVAGAAVEGWTFGRGWEFQPGPVMFDDAIFALARGIGDATHEGSDHADEVRLIALEADTGAVRWSREVTRERGLIDPALRGRAGSFATTTMPLTVDRRTGHLLVGTNVGLVAAYDVADGRLAWALQTQRRRASDGGWPGSRPALLVGGRAWFAPFDSEFAYALPAGPAPLSGELLVEPPRARRGALDLVAAQPVEAAGSRLVLLGQDGRYSAVLVEESDGTRRPATYLAPDERFAGRPAIGAGGLLVAGTRELGVLSLAEDLRLVAASPLPSRGAGRGGDVLVGGRWVHVIGRDTIWIWDRE